MPDPYSNGSRDFQMVLGQLEKLQIDLVQVRTRLCVAHEQEVSQLRSALSSSRKSQRASLAPLRRPPSVQEPCEVNSPHLSSIDAAESGSTKLLELSDKVSAVGNPATCQADGEGKASHQSGPTSLMLKRSASMAAVKRARGLNPTDDTQLKVISSEGNPASPLEQRMIRASLQYEEGLRRASHKYEDDSPQYPSEIAESESDFGPRHSPQSELASSLGDPGGQSLSRKSRASATRTSARLRSNVHSSASIGSKVTFEGEIDEQGSECSGGSNAFDLHDNDEDEVLPIPLRPVWGLTDEEIMKGLLAIKMNNRASAKDEKSKQGQKKLSRSAAMRSQAAVLHVSGVLHPQSNKRLGWDLLGLFAISYDLVMVPLQFFNLKETPTLNVLNWMSCIYWTADILFSLRTGIYVDGDLVMSSMVILQRYAKTWMILDVSLVTIEWISNTVLAGTTGLADASALLRFLRLMRFLRLLRVAKCERVIEEIEVRLNSNSILLVMSIVKQIGYLVMINHMLACFWYGIGNASDGWVDAVEAEKSEDFSYQYFTSLHWSLTQFHSNMEVNPTNVAERIYASFVVLLALVLFSSFLSSITNMMMDLHSLRQGVVRTQRVLRNYLMDHHISRSLSAKVKKYIDAQRSSFSRERNDEDFLRHVLPEDLMTDLLCEARIPLLVAHPLFWDMNKVYPRTSRQLAKEAITSSFHDPCDMIFTAGDAGERTLFINTGKLAYRWGFASPARPSKVSHGSSNAPGVRSLSHMDWVAEAALWMVWEHKGELTSVHASTLLSLSAEVFSQVVRVHSSVLLEVARYAEQFSMIVATRTPSDMMEVPPHTNWELGVPFRGSVLSSYGGQVIEVVSSRGPGHTVGSSRRYTDDMTKSVSMGKTVSHKSTASSTMVGTSSKDRSGAITMSVEVSDIARSTDAAIRGLDRTLRSASNVEQQRSYSSDLGQVAEDSDHSN